MSAKVSQCTGTPVPGSEAIAGSKDQGRRAFLATAIGTIVAAFSADWWGRSPPAAPALVPAPIVGAAELTPETALSFAVPGSDVQGILVRMADGSFAAFDRRCPHLGCPVLWSATRRQLQCPCHAAEFDAATGRVLTGPPPHGLRRLEIEMRDSELWVQGIGTPVEADEIAQEENGKGRSRHACA